MRLILSFVSVLSLSGFVCFAADPEVENQAALIERGRLVAAYERDGENVASSLTEALDDERRVVRLTAIHLLKRIGSPALTGIVQALDNPDPQVRWVAIDALAATGNLTDHWAAIVMDDDPAIRRRTRLALMKKHPLPKGEEFEQFLQALTTRFKTASVAKRKAAVAFLASLKPLPPEVKRFLTAATKDSAKEVREAAYKGILERIDADWDRVGKTLPAESESVEGSGASLDPEELLRRSAWNARVAIALGRKKGKYDQALGLAGKIIDRPYSVYASTLIMSRARRHADLVKAFKEENIVDWPYRATPDKTHYHEDDIRVHSLLLRGEALARTGDGQAAERDLVKAADLATDWKIKRSIWLAMARNRAANLKDDKAAFEAYSNIVDMKKGGGHTYYQAVLESADYLRGQGKINEALATLTKFAPYEPKGIWRHRQLLALAQTLAAAKKIDEAVAKLEKAIDEAKNQDKNKAEALLALGGILTDAGRTERAKATYKQIIDDEKFSSDVREEADSELKKLEDEK